jgi:GAF domain-containing protein
MSFDDSNACAASRAVESTHDVRLETARRRLAESRDEADAIEGLREIVANLLGSEEIGLFRVDHASGTFQVCWSFGIDLENYDLMRALGETGVQHVMRGECQIDIPSRDHARTTARAQAFVPIRVGNRTVAILAVLRLLPQKHAFDRSDMELLTLLSHEAAKPLFGLIGRPQPTIEQPGIRT